MGNSFKSLIEDINARIKEVPAEWHYLIKKEEGWAAAHPFWYAALLVAAGFALAFIL